MEEEKCSLRTNITINVGWQPVEFMFSSEASTVEQDVDCRSFRSTVDLL